MSILIPLHLSILNRALDLFGEPREETAEAAVSALGSAVNRKDVTGPFTPLAQAVAEYMSLSGPWSADGGEYAGQAGYSLTV
jgi:hypothetical protein